MAGIESLLVGRLLGGRYRIEEVIGRGGMGAVYRATDERLGRQVALKVVTVAAPADAGARERLRARFFREARSAAALPHNPNVVPVYDYGSDEPLGLDYLVMELLRGADLATHLARSNRPSLAASLKILLEATRGVAVGHRQGLIHRDVKPGNIFLAETHDHEMQVRVVDFGIAKLAEDDDTLAQLTQDGQVPHSPAFASPEQLRGLTQLTPASDVFSLGAVGYLLLTGERPFTESDRNRLSLGMPLEPPGLRQLNPAIPRAAERVIQRALAYDPDDRFPDAGAMATALEDAIRAIPNTPLEPYLGGAQIRSAEAEEDHTRVAPFEDDHTLLAPIVVDPSPAPSRPIPPRQERLRTPPPESEGRPRRELGGMLTWLLVLLVLLVAGYWIRSELQRDRLARNAAIPPAPDSMPVLTPDVAIEEPAPPNELDAFIDNQEGMRYFNLGQLDSALAHFDRAVQISPGNPDYRRNLGVTLLRLGRLDEAENELGRAIQLDPNRPLPYANLAEVQLARGDTAAAILAIEDHLSRETNPASRGRAERLLRDLLRAQESGYPPLLGEAIEPEVPDQPQTPSADDTTAVPTGAF